MKTDGGGWRYFTHRNTIRCPHWKKKTFHWFSCIIFELWRKRSKQVLVCTKTKKLASSANTFIFWSGNIDYFNTYAFVVFNEWKEWSVCLSVIWDWNFHFYFQIKVFNISLGTWTFLIASFQDSSVSLNHNLYEKNSGQCSEFHKHECRSVLNTNCGQSSCCHVWKIVRQNPHLKSTLQGQIHVNFRTSINQPNIP